MRTAPLSAGDHRDHSPAPDDAAVIDRQTLGNLIPLAAVVIALAEYLFDHSSPRYSSPWFWIALGSTVALLILVQVLRFTGARPHTTAKPDYSATTIMRRRSTDTDDRG